MTAAIRRVAMGALVLSAAASVSAQQIDPSALTALRWRLIGPFRAGRVSAGAVDPADPNTYYFGTPGGGVWKSTNAGQTWGALFDKTGIASIGALAVAPSNPRTIYAGTGEETRGDGVFKSIDGGATWANVGLRETHYIGAIVINPSNADEALVAAIGDRTPGPDRGVFRTVDGGRSWTKVLFLDNESGCASIVSSPDAPSVVYATLYPASGARGASPAPPPPPHGAPPAGQNRQFAPPAAVFKSSDGGATWTRLRAAGLPGSPVGRQAFGVIARSGGHSVFAGTREGLFRSDDGGDTWSRATDDPRIRPVGVITDPGNPQVVYITQTAMYRSTDGGRTFDALAGAPSGDDFQLLWIDPKNSRRLLAGVDQGAIVSVDGGASWSSWYNQPTGQFYHVATDDRFPYHAYAAQQDSGSVAVPNRSDYGEISYRDWYSPGGFEFGYLAPDPLDPDIVFAGGWYRTVVRFDRRTGQFTHVFAPGTRYRSVNNAPMAFSPQDPHTLFYGTQFLMKTIDSGTTWQEVSPDLTDVGTKSGPVRPPQVPSITTFSLSISSPGVFWAATNNGVVQRTADGGTTWQNVSPRDLPEGGAFEIIEAGRHDAGTAFATYIVPNDVRPYIYRTTDAGRTWTRITDGLPETAFARFVREDPIRKGLLYCGTETAMYISADAGTHWQSLQLNLPSSSMRDMVVHGDDLVLVTYGRAMWILDNVSPLRELAGGMPAAMQLLKPVAAIRARWDVNGDTPLPIETPAAENPPEGAVIDYVLPRAAEGELTLTITDGNGRVIRNVSSVAPQSTSLLANVPSYWFGAPAVLSTHAGLNRFAWNLRYPSPKILPFGYFGGLLPYIEYTLADHAIPGHTPREQPEGTLVVPGEYTIELAAGTERRRQTLVVKPDPRVNVSQADFVAQFELATELTDALSVTFDGFHALAPLRASIVEAVKSAAASEKKPPPAVAALRAFEKNVERVQDGTTEEPGVGAVNREMARLFSMVESGDGAPTGPLRRAAAEWCTALAKAIEAWRALGTELPGVNKQLVASRLAPLVVPPPPAAPPCAR